MNGVEFLEGKVLMMEANGGSVQVVEGESFQRFERFKKSDFENL